LLYAVPSRKRKVRFGTAYGTPDYIYLKIADCLMLDNLMIEGVNYVLGKDEAMEHNDETSGHPLYSYDVNLTLSQNQRTLTMPVNTDNLNGVILVVDAVAFGSPAGSVISIQLNND